MTPPSTITLSEWQAALDAVDPKPTDDPDVLTMAEFMHQTGLKRAAARLRMERMLEQKLVTRTTKVITSRIGGRIVVPAFRLLKKREK